MDEMGKWAHGKVTTYKENDQKSMANKLKPIPGILTRIWKQTDCDTETGITTILKIIYRYHNPTVGGILLLRTCPPCRINPW